MWRDVEVARSHGTSVLMGVSSPISSIDGYPPGYRQARYAMNASSPADPAASLFEDLGVLQLLLEPAHRPDLDSYVTQVIGSLIDYDKHHGSHLVDTVAAYLQCDCHLQRAAAALFVHYKTMSYRLARVSELTGLRLDDQEDRFRLQLALKIFGLRQAPTVAADEGANSTGRRNTFRWRWANGTAAGMGGCPGGAAGDAFAGAASGGKTRTPAAVLGGDRQGNAE